LLFKTCHLAEFHSPSSNRSAADPTVVALGEYSTRWLRSRYRRQLSADRA
jgi:hypothetical protein